MDMKHKHKDIEGSRREFSVEVPHKEITEKLEEIYSEMQKFVKIPGFRKGKVPRELVEKYHKKDAREQALSDILSDSYKIAMKESNTVPVALPIISDVNFEEGKDLLFKATVDMRPKVELKNYKNIKVNKQPIEVKDEDVENYIKSLRESYAQFENIESSPLKAGDYAVCDISCEADGKPVYDEQKNILLHLDRSHSVPELVDGLIGANKGESREISATLPENNKDPKFSKKKVLFKVKINELKTKRLPELNDEFVKSLGIFENLAQLKDAVKKDLAHKKENASRADISNQILETILKQAHFTPPKGLVDEEIERLVEKSKEELKKKKISSEDIEKRAPEIKKQVKVNAENSVKLYFILDEIASIEKIEVSDQEVVSTLELLALQSNTPKEKLEKHYKNNDLMGHLKHQLKENKIIDFLISKASVR